MIHLLKEKAKPAAQYKKRKTFELLGSLSDFNKAKEEQLGPSQQLGSKNTGQQINSAAGAT